MAQMNHAFDIDGITKATPTIFYGPADYTTDITGPAIHEEIIVEGITLKMDREKAERRFHAVANKVEHHEYARFAGRDISYIGFGYHDDWLIECGDFSFALGSEGVTITLRDWIAEESGGLNLETEWVRFIPEIKWFMSIEGEDFYCVKEY